MEQRENLYQGDYTADLIIEYQIVTKRKVAAAPSDMHIPPSRNYLLATGKPLCLLINFGRPKVEIRLMTA